jgi:ABC-type lipoprotein export system ATPase subunit
MARGWESKSVEIQIEEADISESDIDSMPREESVELRSKRQGLMLQRSRFLQEMETARNPRYREMLNELLKHVEQELAKLTDK